jgi:hypothetical protein
LKIFYKDGSSGFIFHLPLSEQKHFVMYRIELDEELIKEAMVVSDSAA